MHTVTLRVFNVLAQLVAVPKLDGSNAPVDKLRLGCGSFVARWDRKGPTGHDAASGVYIYQLVVDGDQSGAKKMIAK